MLFQLLKILLSFLHTKAKYRYFWRQLFSMSNRLNASLGFIFVTVLIDIIGIGIIIPALPDLVTKLTGESLSEAASYAGWLIFSYAFMQFLFAPVMGELSDKFGRRPILLISLLGLGLDYLFHAFAPTIFWLFVGRIIAGICGASITVANSYIADISTPEKRAQNFGIIGVAFGLGFIVGPAIGGLLAEIDLKLPFLFAAALSFLNLIYGYFVLPESLKPENRRSIEFKRLIPGKALKHLSKYPLIIGLAFSYFLVYVAGQSVQSTWTFYTQFKYGWDTGDVGLSLSVVGVTVAIVQGGLIRVALKKLGKKRTIYLGMIFWSIGLFLFSIALEGWMIYAFILPYCLGGIAGPTLQGVISNQVPSNEQGELQGALTSLIALSSILGPPMMTGLFKVFSQSEDFYFPGAPFALGCILTITSFLLIRKPLKIIMKSEDEITNT